MEVVRSRSDNFVLLPMALVLGVVATYLTMTQDLHVAAQPHEVTQTAGPDHVTEEKVEEQGKKVEAKTETATLKNETLPNSAVYYLVVGSFRSKRNAEGRLALLRLPNELKPEIIEVNTTGGVLYRLSVARSASLESIQKLQREYSDRFPGCWVSRID